MEGTCRISASVDKAFLHIFFCLRHSAGPPQRLQGAHIAAPLRGQSFALHAALDVELPALADAQGRHLRRRSGASPVHCSQHSTERSAPPPERVSNHREAMHCGLRPSTRTPLPVIHVPK